MPRPEDERDYDRAERATALRIGTVAAVGATTLDVTVPGSATPLTGVGQLTSFTATVGARVALLMDGGRPFAIGIVK